MSAGTPFTSAAPAACGTLPAADGATSADARPATAETRSRGGSAGGPPPLGGALPLLAARSGCSASRSSLRAGCAIRQLRLPSEGSIHFMLSG